MKNKIMGTNQPAKEPQPPAKIVYRSKDVAIPDDFLKSEPADAQPITHNPIDFENSVLPEFKDCYAVVLDHVLSPSECSQLLAFAEDSVMDEDKMPSEASGPPSSWRPALVHIGGGYEVENPSYRKGERIIWDQQEIVNRLWARMVPIPEIQEKLLTLPGAVIGVPDRKTNYKFHSVNKRMRFLKYTAGQFFKPHCDGPYGEETPEGDILQTYMTVHLYLNDSRQEVGPGVDLDGGATSFLSRDGSRTIPVNPKAGRVLIFQHSRLRHSGDDVVAGEKFTVRTDILYKVPEDELAPITH
ncbi:hypothetical protein F4808DRAFT_447911 [Astrocystis sublimbata]|nr:hypothetical protein F4808DRAFT_447911 [Astrocystis sublimbata]